MTQIPRNLWSILLIQKKFCLLIKFERLCISSSKDIRNLWIEQKCRIYFMSNLFDHPENNHILKLCIRCAIMTLVFLSKMHRLFLKVFFKNIYSKYFPLLAMTMTQATNEFSKRRTLCPLKQSSCLPNDNIYYVMFDFKNAYIMLVKFFTLSL